MRCWPRCKHAGELHLAHDRESDAQLRVVNNAIDMGFPAETRGREGIADVLVRGFAGTYENVYSFYLASPPERAVRFSCPWLVGMTEKEARQKLGAVKIYQSDFRPMKNVLAGRNERALYKMICDEADKIVGIHMIGPDAPEIMQAAAVAVKAGLSKVDFDATCAIHPTMAEELVLMR